MFENRKNTFKVTEYLFQLFTFLYLHSNVRSILVAATMEHFDEFHTRKINVYDVKCVERFRHLGRPLLAATVSALQLC